MEVTAPPVMTSACHCDGCKAMSGSAFSLSAMVPEASLMVCSGDVVSGGARTPGLDHYFCADCKSWLFTRMAGLSHLVNLRAPLFDRPDWARPFMETMTSQKYDWVDLPIMHAFSGFPDPDDMDGLLRAFADSR